jgi:predicted ribosome quality control (RQC) complex YloA/Tae2 family protein
VFRLASGREVWVGRSARDNDLLTQRHAHGHDLWLHAQGVEGSHVVLRTGGQPALAADVEAAAQLAAQFSKAKHSQTVPVVVTEKRYVRKPRKAVPGAVVAERAKTLFVSPQIPPGCEAVHSR